MNSSISLQTNPSRKDQLHSQISEAIEANDEKLLFYLEGIWVHRYGLSNLESYRGHLYDQRNPEETYQALGFENSDNSSLEHLAEVRTSLASSTDSEERVFDSEDFVEASSLNKIISSNSGKYELSENSVSEDIATHVVESIDDSIDYVSSPPPTPAIRRLRRWLPSLNDEAAQAS